MTAGERNRKDLTTEAELAGASNAGNEAGKRR